MAKQFTFASDYKHVEAIIPVPAFLEASDGCQLAYFVHHAANQQPTTSVMLFYHGGGAYQVGVYQQMAYALAVGHGITSYLFDIRGHGASAGERGDAPSVERVMLDVQEAVAFVQAKHPQGALFLAGHSSGCGLLLNAQQQGYIKSVAGLIFIAPFLGADSKTALQSDFIKTVRVWPFIWHGITGWGTHTPAVYFNYPATMRVHSPHLLDYYTIGMALAVTPKHADACLKDISLPLHIIVGKNDLQISGQAFLAMRDAHELAPATELRVLSDVGHFSVLGVASDVIATAISMSGLSASKQS